MNALRDDDQLDCVPVLLERAAIRIGRYGWWKSPWGLLLGDDDEPCCIWIAVSKEVEEFGIAHPHLKHSMQLVLDAALMDYFSVENILDVYTLNDRQPSHEGQGWAIYHLNILALRLRSTQRRRLRALLSD